MAKREEEKKEPLYRGFCDRKNCEYYKEEEMISYTNENHKTIMELCTFLNRRSFGCIASCPKVNYKLD